MGHGIRPGTRYPATPVPVWQVGESEGVRSIAGRDSQTGLAHHQSTSRASRSRMPPPGAGGAAERRESRAMLRRVGPGRPVGGGLDWSDPQHRAVRSCAGWLTWLCSPGDRGVRRGQSARLRPRHETAGLHGRAEGARRGATGEPAAAPAGQTKSAIWRTSAGVAGGGGGRCFAPDPECHTASRGTRL